MTDERDYPVPDDLVVLDHVPEELTLALIEKIMKLDWWRPGLDDHPRYEDLILVSAAALIPLLSTELSLTDPTELLDVRLPQLQSVDYLLPVLHRQDRQRFYSA